MNPQILPRVYHAPTPLKAHIVKTFAVWLTPVYLYH